MFDSPPVNEDGVWEEALTEQAELFGSRWPEVEAALDFLESIGIYYVMQNPRISTSTSEQVSQTGNAPYSPPKCELRPRRHKTEAGIQPQNLSGGLSGKLVTQGNQLRNLTVDATSMVGLCGGFGHANAGIGYFELLVEQGFRLT